MDTSPAACRSAPEDAQRSVSVTPGHPGPEDGGAAQSAGALEGAASAETLFFFFLFLLAEGVSGHTAELTFQL